MWFDSSVDRALHQHRKVMGSNPVQSWIFFRLLFHLLKLKELWGWQFHSCYNYYKQLTHQEKSICPNLIKIWRIFIVYVQSWEFFQVFPLGQVCKTLKLNTESRISKSNMKSQSKWAFFSKCTLIVVKQTKHSVSKVNCWFFHVPVFLEMIQDDPSVFFWTQ